MAAAVAATSPGARAEQASQPGSPAAARLDVGRHHSCAVLAGGSVRCWGYGAQGQLGYADTATIGDDETPAAVGPVRLGRPAIAISAGDFHTCALLDDGTVRCWGFGANGRLGYAGAENVGDDETPGSGGPVHLGPGRTAIAISAGLGHTCAVLDDGTVRCWGYGENGALGYANSATIGDDEMPAAAGPVDLGPGRTAVAVSAGGDFTCALLDDGSIRCWGLGLDGRLGYGNTQRVGDDETPGSVGPVDLGLGRTARALSAGARATCAVLDDGTVRCWGEGREGSLGYGDGKYIGDNETPGSVGPVDLGAGRTAAAISVGRHSCALLDRALVRCWGPGARGQLGYASTERIGDTETPGSVGPVELGGLASAVGAGELHSCARLEDAAVRCWGAGDNGRLGRCEERDIGDDETPVAVGPLALGQPGIAGDGCPLRPLPAAPPAAVPAAPVLPRAVRPVSAVDALQLALAGQRERERAYHRCLRAATAQVRSERRRARRLPSIRRRAALRRAERRAAPARRSCLRRHARVPGRVEGVRAQSAGRGRIRLRFRAAGTDGTRPPAATRYLVKQSRRPIRTARDFVRASALCGGRCRFAVGEVGASVELTITDLRSRQRYHYAVAARDNVSGRIGRRSRAVRARAG